MAADPSADAPLRTLEILRDLLACDAGSLIARDRQGPEFRVVAALDYPAGTAEAMARSFPGSPWMPLVCASPLPPSISTEAAQTFRRGWIYKDIIRPVGFRDGISAPLRRDGRVLGLVHLSSEAPRAFDEDAQLLLQALLGPLAAVLDPLDGSVGEDEWAALVGPDGCARAAGGLGIPPLLEDARLRALIDAFQDSHARKIAFVHRSAGVWWQVHVARDSRGGSPALTLRAIRRDLPYGLTEREVEVLTLLATGCSDQSISRQLCVSTRTVHSHMQHILGKTGARGRLAAAILAHREGILLPTPETIRTLSHQA